MRAALLAIALLATGATTARADSACAPPAGVAAAGTAWRLEGHVTLATGCTYAAEIAIDRPDVTLDCNGATLDGRDGLRIAIMVAQADATSARVENVTIRNCTIRNYATTGIAVRNIHTGRARELSPNQLRQLSPRNVRIDGVTISGISGSAVNIARFVQGVVAGNMALSDNEGPAIYLSPSSAGNTIQNSTFANNGFRKTLGKREGVAVDGSVRNVFTGNTFRGNAAGGIFLYKNCGEKNGFVRKEGASDNRIAGNVFEGMPVGVWIASRQSRRLENFLCSDGYHTVGDTYYPDRAFVKEARKGRGYQLIVDGRVVRTLDRLDAVPMYAFDVANGNVVEGNDFRGVGIGVRVEDDGNRVTGNRFGSGVRQEVRIGSPVRERKPGPDRPVTDVDVGGNQRR